jgi:hypothetical protein
MHPSEAAFDHALAEVTREFICKSEEIVKMRGAVHGPRSEKECAAVHAEAKEYVLELSSGRREPGFIVKTPKKQLNLVRTLLAQGSDSACKEEHYDPTPSKPPAPRAIVPTDADRAAAEAIIRALAGSPGAGGSQGAGGLQGGAGGSHVGAGSEPWEIGATPRAELAVVPATCDEAW